ncbi:MAG: 30S ribosomal protein S9 [Deltaproteobacteria bacterium]|jgi:small subunit ribosomal protein S9|nr:30S ribosomal protein S9 [Deltaproteobacteria bacterium]
MLSNKVKKINATGRRKTATARVYCSPATKGEGKIIVNGRDFENYFPRQTAQQIIMQPLELTESVSNYDFKINVRGGGLSGQAGAVLLGIARVLEATNGELRPLLRKAGFLTRDPRSVERKKPGKHKARKSTQFSKR